VSRSASLLAVTLVLAAWPALATGFDPEHTRFDFQLRARWGARITGQFPRYAGQVDRHDDGRQSVRVALAVGAVQVAHSVRYTDIARSPRFFDAARYPEIVFESEPYTPALLARGGALRGRLQLHGVSRNETFEVEPATCARPGMDCDIVARGSVRRDAYAMNAMSYALGNRVEFTLRVRLLHEADT